MKHWTIRVVASVLVLGGFAIFATAATSAPAPTPSLDDVSVPSGASPSQTDVESILANADANEAMADSAPQQQVVNGWAAKDLLAAIALEQQAASEQRLAAEERWATFAKAELANGEEARKSARVIAALLLVMVVLAGVAVVGQTVQPAARKQRAAIAGPPAPLGPEPPAPARPTAPTSW